MIRTGRTRACSCLSGRGKVDTYGKFMLAVLGAVIAGAGSEGILRLRVLWDNHLSSRAGAPGAVRLVPEGSSSQIALYFIHRTAGYLAMLLAMTFQLEIFIAVLSGLALGYALFNLESSKVRSTSAQKGPSSAGEPFSVFSACYVSAAQCTNVG